MIEAVTTLLRGKPWDYLRTNKKRRLTINLFCHHKNSTRRNTFDSARKRRLITIHKKMIFNSDCYEFVLIKRAVPTRW